MRGLRFIPAETHFDFMKLRFLAFALSFIVLAGSVFLTVQKGLNFGIDFAGGTLIEVKVEEAPDLGALRAELNGLGLGGISIQEFGAPEDLLIRMPEQDPSSSKDFDETSGADVQKEAVEKVRGALDARFENIDYRRSEFVGPQVGEELKLQGMYAVLFSLIGILAYIWFRFEWQFGVAAIVALAHDAVAVIGLFALSQLEFSLSTVAAILMVAGYSINDTVIIFDRIREELRKYKKKPVNEVMNMAVNATLSRTLVTSLTTLLALIALYVFGGEVIRDFIYALIFGILIGTYSSVFVASPVLGLMNIRRNESMESPEAADPQEA